jgi:hypothetical protein
MKLPCTIVMTLGLTSSALLLPIAVQAQEPAPTATPSVSTPDTAASAAPSDKDHAGREGRKGRMAELTPAERQQLKAAHEKALQDPAVKAAEGEKTTDRRAYQKSVHDAMLRADPTIAPILEKMRAHRGKAESPAAEQ